MQVEKDETILAEDKWLLVKVTTDNGIVGIGEAGLHGVTEAAEAAVRTFGRYLVGKDPLQIEHHSQFMYRFSHFRGAAVGGAISALDIALWDIAGKHFEAPVYQLMGGKVRDKARVYMHVGGDSVEDLYASAKAAADEGFTAVRFTPFVENDQQQYYNMRYSAMLAEAVARVAAVREAVGNDVDLCVEIHRRLAIPEAIQLGREIAEFRPFFYEDPTTPDSNESMAESARNIPIPIATGERLSCGRGRKTDPWRVRRPPGYNPAHFAHYEPPPDHLARFGYGDILRLPRPNLRATRVEGISLLWGFPPWGAFLACLPRTLQRVALAVAFAAGRMIPAWADAIAVQAVRDG